MVTLVLAALGKYSSSMQQASLGGSHFVERAVNILDNATAFKMLSRSVMNPCTGTPTPICSFSLCRQIAFAECSCGWPGVCMGMGDS